MQSIGERLEEARKKKGISIREAAEATKIRGDYLQQFENNRFDINLTEIYVRGFLRAYALYLKLPADWSICASASRRGLPPCSCAKQNNSRGSRMIVIATRNPISNSRARPVYSAASPSITVWDHRCLRISVASQNR